MTSSKGNSNSIINNHKIKEGKKMKVFMTLPAGAPAEGIKVVVEGNLLRLYFGYTKVEATATSTDGSTVKNGNSMDASYSAENIDIEGGVRDYAAITAAIVNDMYDLNDVQAILANKALADDAKSAITDDKRKEYLSEYNSYQEYRAMAKEVATKAVGMLQVKAENLSKAAATAAAGIVNANTAADTTETVEDKSDTIEGTEATNK